MKIFVTGVTGFIGGSVAQALVAAGHTVRGLVRSEAKMPELRTLGIEPVVGDLDSLELLEQEARGADAVINCASSDHRPSVEAMLAGLKGSNKPFLHTSGSSVIGDDACGLTLSPHIFDETTPFIVDAMKQPRYDLDLLIQSSAQKEGIRTVVLCNTMIYGHGRGLGKDSVQIPMLAAQGRRSGVVRVIGTGSNVWSNVHIDDAVALHLLALEKAPAGSFYFVENGEESYGNVCGAIARRLKLPLESWTVDEATAEWGVGHARYSLGSNSRVRAVRARTELGWQPKYASVTEWIEKEL